MAGVGDITNLAAAIQAVTGSETQETQQTKITPEGVTRIINDILAGESGLGRIGSATRKSGLYNSTTQELLVNDLLSRAATRAELAGAPTTTTTDVKGAGLMPLVTTIGGSALLNSILKNGVKGTLNTVLGKGAAAPTASGVVTGTVPEVAKLTTGAAAEAGAGSTVGSFLQGNAAQLGGGLISGLLQGEDALKPENLLLTSALGFLTGGGFPGLGAALLGTGAGAFGEDIFGGVVDIGEDIISGIGDFFGDLF